MNWDKDNAMHKKHTDKDLSLSRYSFDLDLTFRTCFSVLCWLSSSGMKSRQICMDGIPATVTGSSSLG